MTHPEPITIMFADVCGSTKLFELRGDEAARSIIGQVLSAMGEVVMRHGGRVLGTIGDEVMGTFPDPLSGLLAATDMQRRMAHDPVFLKDSLAIRIGVHHGEALVELDDVYGDAVNTAARMASLAKRDQIMTTATTVRGLPEDALRVRVLGTARVSGKQLPIEIVDVMWQEDLSNLTTVKRAPISDVAPDTGGARLVLRYGGQVIPLNPRSPAFTLGRDAHSSLVIDDEWVSRYHALIEYKRGHYLIGDHSTNGTWVAIGGGDELRLHHDEMHLRKSGTISLGQAVSANRDRAVYFQALG
jgi:class 3 adenylate cyclase